MLQDVSTASRNDNRILTYQSFDRWLSDLLGVRFDGSVGVAGRLWLRKEILKQGIST
jgi:hypothetical protein